MMQFLLIDYAPGAGLVHIYGIIEAETPRAAAESVGSQIERETAAGSIIGMRYLLREGKFGLNRWFLEEVRPLKSRPARMGDAE